jgi:hypothetical protein
MAGRRRRTKPQIAADEQPCGPIPPDVPKRRRAPTAKIPTTQDQRIEHIIDLMLHHKWDGRVTPFELAQKWGCTMKAIVTAANQAGARIATATGNLERRVQTALDKLDDIRTKAMAANQFSAAVRAVELELKVAGVFSKQRPDRAKVEEANPRGLPPELAQLDPEATYEEVEHFAGTANAAACTLDVCRVHGKAAPAPEQMH